MADVLLFSFIGPNNCIGKPVQRRTLKGVAKNEEEAWSFLPNFLGACTDRKNTYDSIQ